MQSEHPLKSAFPDKTINETINIIPKKRTIPEEQCKKNAIIDNHTLLLTENKKKIRNENKQKQRTMIITINQ